MIEITNGMIRTKIPKKDLDSYLKLGYKAITKEKKEKPKPIVEVKEDVKDNTKGNTKQR